MYSEDHWLTYEEVRAITGYSAGLLLEYNAVINAVPTRWKTSGAARAFQPPTLTFHGQIIGTWTTSLVRSKLVRNKYKQPCAVNFWGNKYVGFYLTADIWALAFKCTPETRLRVLHFKITHNIYPTNILLRKMGVAENSNCSFCNVRDYIEHFFYNCIAVREMWAYIENELSKHAGSKVSLGEVDVMFGITTGYNAHIRKYLNAYILVGKMCISKYKYGQYHDLKLLFQHEMSLRKQRFQQLENDQQIEND